MDTELQRTLKLTLTFFLASLIAVLSGCIVAVDQPKISFPGHIFTTELEIVPDDATSAPDLITPCLYIGTRLPLGWSVVDDPIYYGGPTGTLIYSPTLVGEFESELGVIPDTYWWVGSSPNEMWSPEITITTVIKIQVAISATGPYTINYAAGADVDPPTAPAYVVTETITIVDVEGMVHLPIILSE